jgi:hypothetical protein
VVVDLMAVVVDVGGSGDCLTVVVGDVNGGG